MKFPDIFSSAIKFPDFSRVPEIPGPLATLNNNLNIEGENVSLPQTNQKKFPDLLSKYGTKSKYDVCKIKIKWNPKNSLNL